MPDHIAAATRVLDAYNAKDFAAFRELVSPSIDMAPLQPQLRDQ